MSNNKLNSVSIFPLGKMLTILRNEDKDSLPIISVCEKYEALLKGGSHATQLCESFVADLSAVATTKASKKIVNESKTLLNDRSRDIENANAIYSLYNGGLMFVAESLEDTMTNYMSDKSEENRNTLLESLSLYAGNKFIDTIIENVKYDGYDVRHGKVLESRSSAKKVKQVKTYLASDVEKIVAQRIEESKQAELAERAKVKSVKDIDTKINLHSTIRTILERCNNQKLNDYCMQYFNALNEGKSEESLCEAFVSGLRRWDYMPAVETEASALNSRISKYKQEIDLKKILEAMAQTSSYYIVPLIEDCIIDYIERKNMNTRAILKQRLAPFEFDPFVRDIETALICDQSIPNSVYLGEAEKANPYVNVDTIFSPIEYIKEGESVFNIHGIYYLKKGNTISRYPRKNINNLSESFRTLCNLINSDNVSIDSLDESITVYSGSDIAKINETGITINGKRIRRSDLNDTIEKSYLLHENKSNFYNAVMMLSENYDKIAYVDFAKHISLKENAGQYVDIFKVKDNMYVTTVNESMGISTFYKNVNPVQCRNYVNEHMGIRIDDAFSDLMPKNDDVMKMIAEQKAIYEGYIEELEDQEKKFKEARETATPDMLPSIDSALEIISSEMEKAKADYADYTNTTDKMVNGDPDDAQSSVDDDVADVEKETQSDMEEPIEPTTDPEGNEFGIDNDIDSLDSDDAFMNNMPSTDEPLPDENNITDFDGILDTPASSVDSENSDNSFKVVQVKYNENIKSGVKSNKGEVVLMIPSVDANGDIHNDMKRVSFYVDNSGKPILNNEYMPLDMYVAIIDAIKNDPNTSSVSEVPTGEETNTDTDLTSHIETPEETGNETETFDFLGDEGISDDEPFNLDSLFSEPGNEEDNNEESEETTNSEEDSLEAPESGFDVTEDEPIEPQERETPEETRAASEEVKFPKDLPLNVDDIKPITKKEFLDDLDSAGIKHSENSAVEKNICFTIKNKADVRWLQGYFHEWKGFNNADFENFFPELKGVLTGNTETVPTAKYESYKKCIILPNNKKYRTALGLTDENNSTNIEVVTESKRDLDYLYRKLKTVKLNEAEDENTKVFIDSYEKVYGINESVKVPYNSFLEQKLLSLGFRTKIVDESLVIDIPMNKRKKASAIFESFYKEAKPISVRNFSNALALDENVKITIEAEGKSVTIDTDDLESYKKEAEHNNESDNPDDHFDPSQSFKGVTTFGEGSMNPFGSPDDDDADEDKEDKKDEDKGDKNDKGEDEKKKGKKFIKKSKKKDSDKDEDSEEAKESLNTKFRNSLNESAQPNVLDNVKLKDGSKGQIIYQMANGNFIVNVAGHTVEATKSDVTMLHERPDTVECPFKYDPATLKGLYEQHVACGMFINDMCITPRDCYVRYCDFANANANTQVPIMVEGTNTFVEKKYLRILENINDFANINDYKQGIMNISGETVLYNSKDYAICESNAEYPVRTLMKGEDGEWHLVNLTAGSFSVN